MDPEVEDRLAQETEVRRTEEDLGDKVHPLCGYGLVQAKEEARKLRTLRVLMRVSSDPQMNPFSTHLFLRDQ